MHKMSRSAAADSPGSSERSVNRGFDTSQIPNDFH